MNTGAKVVIAAGVVIALAGISVLVYAGPVDSGQFGTRSDTWCTLTIIGCMTLIAGLVTTAGGGGWALSSKKGSAVQMQSTSQQEFPQQVVQQQPGFPPEQESP